MKIAAIVLGLLTLCCAASAQIGPIPAGWILMGQNIAAKNENVSAYRISPILLPKDTIVEVIMVDSRKESQITTGYAITKLGKPLVLGYRNAAWDRALYVAGAIETGERRLLYTASTKEAFDRFLPDVSRLIDSWIIAPASQTDSSSKHWGTQEGSNWLAGGTNAIVPPNGMSSGSTSVPPSNSGGGARSPSMGMSPSGASGWTGSVGAGSAPSASQIMSPNVAAAPRRDAEEQKQETLIYDPITRKFRIIRNPLNVEDVTLDGEYAYNSDRFGGSLQAHLGTLDLIVTLKGDTFKIRQSGSNYVLAEGKFRLQPNQIRFEVNPETVGEYGFLIVSQYEGKVEKLAIGGTVLTRLR